MMKRKAAVSGEVAAYVRLYAFLSQIIPYGDPALEKLYSYGRFLLPHLPKSASNSAMKWAYSITASSEFTLAR
jgi:type I restriction enzyme, R subunit